jgi:ATP-dependent RNA helicase DDX49/DBP8
MLYMGVMACSSHVSGYFKTSVDLLLHFQLEPIFEALPEKRQTLMFSATMTDAIERVKELTCSGEGDKAPLFWSEGDGNRGEDAEADVVIQTVSTLDQKYVLVPPGGDLREALMVQLLLDFRAKNEHGSAMVFTKTCK